MCVQLESAIRKYFKPLPGNPRYPPLVTDYPGPPWFEVVSTTKLFFASAWAKLSCPSAPSYVRLPVLIYIDANVCTVTAYGDFSHLPEPPLVHCLHFIGKLQCVAYWLQIKINLQWPCKVAAAAAAGLVLMGHLPLINSVY